MGHECSECSFVQDMETIRTFLVPRDDKKMVTKKPRFIGKFTMPGWVGHSGFYLFKCKKCGNVCVDYPHDYTSFGLMYLRCDNCREKLPLEVTEERAIYERENGHIPKPTKKERARVLEDVIAGVEGKGVKVLVPGFNEEMTVLKSSRINLWNVGIVLLALWTLGIFFLTYLN